MNDSKIDIRGCIYAIAFYVTVVFGLFLHRKCEEMTLSTYDYQYSTIAVIITICMFLLLGVFLAYLASRRHLTLTTHILELVFIILPAALMLLSEFTFAQNTYMLYLPVFIKCYQGQLPAVGGAIIGCSAYATIHSMIKEKRK